MNTGILKYPGGHGNDELLRCLSVISSLEVKEIWYKEPIPDSVELLFIAGGFPCMKNCTIEKLREESPAIDNILSFSSSGKYIIGINQGFRLLCELDLLPGEMKNNISGKFISKYVYLKPESQHSAITSSLSADEVFRVPLSTYTGMYYADEDELIKMRQKGQIVFRYSDQLGRITESINETGSKDNIAAVCNTEKNVFGIAPQPERGIATEISDGYRLFEAMIEGIYV